MGKGRRDMGNNEIMNAPAMSPAAEGILTATIKAAIELSYRTGTPLERIPALTKQAIERIRVCQKVAARLADEPLTDVKKLLMYGFNRTEKQYERDKHYVKFIFDLQYVDTDRRHAKYVADHYAKKLIQIGESTGDWKPIDKGLKHYETIHGLDRDAPDIDPTKNTADLPVVFTPNVSDIDPDRKRVSDDERRKLFEQYGATEDQISSFIDREKERILNPENAEYVEAEGE
jgi:hypothetical protein